MNWFKRLFCKHNYRKDNSQPPYQEQLYYCTKCGDCKYEHEL